MAADPLLGDFTMNPLDAHDHVQIGQSADPRIEHSRAYCRSATAPFGMRMLPSCMRIKAV